MALYNVPPKPVKVPPDQVLYWQIIEAKKVLLIAMHRASQAKTAGDEHVFTPAYCAVASRAELNTINPVSPRRICHWMPRPSPKS